MAIYNYVALKNNKDIVTGKVEAESLRDARDSVRKLGFLPTKVTEENLKKDDQKVDNSPGTMKSLGLQDRIEFTSTLQILAQSGIPIIESLMFIENDAAKLKLRLVSKELRKQIMGGSTFADTVAKYPEIFGQVYIGLVKAGEDSGELEKTLERLMELMNKEANIRGKVIGTLMYPMFVIVLAVFIVLVMLMFVFPVFKDMFDNMGQELPWITATLMKCGIFLKTYWYFVPLIFISIFGGISFIFKWEPSRRKIDENVLKIPLLTDLVQYSNFANFIAVLQVAYDAGVPIIECLYLSILTLTNYTLKEQVAIATGKVQQGQHLSTALRATGVMPKMILFMISTGEQSGRLGDMMGQATKFIDKKLDTIIDTMTKMIEPIMLIVIGSIVLVLALALYLPLFGSYMNM
ncbi:type II secretion system F family protein [bacterium]|uniref:Type II secretion system F family protein n=1 Tax=Candidatus Scatenecus faecavium TaxID=2840915 RepID=A0A9D1FX75_9BACT|nr:type II secretion system F family protein [bacterium]HIS83598.1 type II secretion system F family protein [Candidatus Scatenecus faecavium]